MKSCKKYWLKYQIRKYENFLLKEGIREAKKTDKNIRLGLEETLRINDNPFSSIYLPKNENGKINISPLLNIGAKNNPEEARKYIIYQEILKRLER